MAYVKVECKIAGRTLSLETGKIAKQADGSVLASYGETKVLVTAQSAGPRPGLGFFPLTVDYREKTYAAGKFPGGFFKREARPTTKEILTCRLIDRSIRPMFPDGYKNEVQVLCNVLQVDHDVDPDLVGMIGAFAAVMISSIPFDGVLGACRMGYIGDKVVVNPSIAETSDRSNRLNLIMTATKDSVQMVESGADEIAEDTILDALELGQETCATVVELIDQLVKKAGKPKTEFIPEAPNTAIDKELEKKFEKKIDKAVSSKGLKHERQLAVSEVRDEAIAYFEEKFAASETADEDLAYLRSAFKEMTKNSERSAILKGRRTDGRKHEEIREISIDVGTLSRLHGSAFFTRGETQTLVTTTLGTVDDEQIVDGLETEVRKKFMLHYNFPPFCVGEVRMMRGPARREIGHGALAERALELILPHPDVFPYTIRLVSEVLESNGSSSMATVCGGTLALMDAGVPIRQPVAGIAMGLIKDGRKTAILSDIQGSEDHCGDMDFKVAGTQFGITALQMDIKCTGLTRALLKKALEQAKVGRIHILKSMMQAIKRPRQELSRFAPRLERIKINPERIGILIGPGGKHIRALQEETQTKVNVDDEGWITVAGQDPELVQLAVERIQGITAEVEIGKVYQGKVVSIKEFGAFIEILPGQEGLCHVSELSDDFVRSVTDVVETGDVLEVKVLDVDPLGKIRLSRKALLEDRRERGGDSESEEVEAASADGEGEARPTGRDRQHSHSGAGSSGRSRGRSDRHSSSRGGDGSRSGSSRSGGPRR